MDALAHTCATQGSNGAMCFHKYDKVLPKVWRCASSKYDWLLPVCTYKYEQGVQFGKVFLV